MLSLSGAACSARFEDGPPPPDAVVQVVTVSFGETGTATFSNVTTDTGVELNGTTPQGADDHTSVESGSWFALYRFDLSGIPSPATVISAQLELSTIGDGSLLATGSARVYRLLVTWEEAEVGHAGAGAPGSRDPTMLGEFMPAAEDRYSVPIPGSLVESWIASPSTNAGILIDSDGTGHLHLGAREGVPANAALLIVTYELPIL